jgi:hypothetical protein
MGEPRSLLAWKAVRMQERHFDALLNTPLACHQPLLQQRL